MTERTPPPNDTASATGFGASDAGGGSPRRGPLDPSPQEDPGTEGRAAAAFVERAKAHFRRAKHEAEEEARHERRRQAVLAARRTQSPRRRGAAAMLNLKRDLAAAEVFKVVLSRRPGRAPRTVVDRWEDALTRLDRDPNTPVLMYGYGGPPLVLDLTEEELIAVLDEVDRLRRADEGEPSPRGMEDWTLRMYEGQKVCDDLRLRLHRGELDIETGRGLILDLVQDFTDPDRALGRSRRKQLQKPRERLTPEDLDTATREAYRELLRRHRLGESYAAIATSKLGRENGWNKNKVTGIWRIWKDRFPDE